MSCAEQQDIEDEQDREMGEVLRFIAARVDHLRIERRGTSIEIHARHPLGQIDDSRSNLYDAIMCLRIWTRDLPPIAATDAFEEKVGADTPGNGLDHSKCRISRGICGSITAGQGVLDSNGYFEISCQVCADKIAKREREAQS
jgi:hypothetical protein